MSSDLGVASGLAAPMLVVRPTAAPAAAVASFVGTDAATGGNWTSAYGADGYAILGGQTSLPSYATLTPTAALTCIWAPTTSDPRALLTSPTGSPSARVAGCWYSPSSFSLDAKISDGATHQVSLYALDWDLYLGGRSEQVDVVDDATGAVLDSRTLTAFSGGVYATWQISGDVTFRVTNTGSQLDNAVVDALFFGGKPAGANPTPAPAPYTPSQVRHAYGFDQVGLDGTGQTIAIIDAYDDPNIAADLATFDRRFGLPAADFVKATPFGTPRYDAGWSQEISLDVEWAHAIAPGARILLVEALSASSTDLLNAVDYAVSQGVKQISMSWGGGEFSGESTLDSHFNKPGVTFFASAGDSGAAAGWPAISPYVTAVGGTNLKIDAGGNRISETGWTGSGGGTSTRVSRPSYQNGFQSSSFRQMPDVSYDADPNTGFYVYDSNGGGGWYQIGGTSAGAPQWAGLAALVNQGRVAAGKATLGTGLNYGANTALYQLAGGSSYTNARGDFYDVTSGSNGTSAKTGYDTVTGLGSPVAHKLIADLIAS
jgi:subtilase family serine protease